MTETPEGTQLPDIAANLKAVRGRIDAACRQHGRDPGAVRLLPVSKTLPPAAVLTARAAGYRRFGENRVQEAQAKAAELAGADVEWAVIGHLQTNKARFVAEFASEFQALDSLATARELHKRLAALDRTLDVLVQVNSSAEPQKYGLPPADVPGFVRELGGLERLRVRGLMTLALFSSDAQRVGECFARTVAVQRELRDRTGDDWPELSMGMSGDFELAIAYGATCVRVGQAIFGARLDPAHYWPARRGGDIEN